jgi:hypothetical protein
MVVPQNVQRRVLRGTDWIPVKNPGSRCSSTASRVSHSPQPSRHGQGCRGLRTRSGDAHRQHLYAPRSMRIAKLRWCAGSTKSATTISPHCLPATGQNKHWIEIAADAYRNYKLRDKNIQKRSWLLSWRDALTCGLGQNHERSSRGDCCVDDPVRSA